MNTSSTIDNPPESRRFGFWGNLRLSRKLLMAFGALFIFAVIIAIITLNGLNQTQAAYEDALAQGIEIRQISEELQSSLLQARSNEKDFLLHWREEGFYTAKLNYVAPFTQNLANMRIQIANLSEIANKVTGVSTDSITQLQYEDDIASLNGNVDAYEKSFNALVRAFQDKGFDNSSTDLESKFRSAAGTIDTKLSVRNGTEKDLDLEKLQSSFYRIRLNEKDYLLSTDPNYIVSIRTLMPQLQTSIARTDQLDPEDKAELVALTREYLAAIESLVKLDEEINSYNEELGAVTSEMELSTAKLKSLGGQLADKSINKAKDTSAQTLATSLLAVAVVLVLSILLAFTFSRQLTRPITLLTKIAQEISEGNYLMQAQVKSNDEIGILAKTFNTMTVQLRGALQNLESHARELELQSVELERANQESQHRNQQLQTIAEIAHYISSEKDLKKLLPLITQIVSEQFGFYHVGVFLLDDSRKYAVLLASNSAGGQAMLRRHHSLEVGLVGIVGNVTATGAPRIATDTGKDAAYFNNPDLPQTRSELALPLRTESRVIGALDIQSTETNAFSDEDVEVLTILADEVSIAIENARLFNQIEKSLAESDALQHQYLRETWRKLPQEEKISGYRYSVAGAIPLGVGTEPVFEQENKSKREVHVPIILRGETIGTLSVQVPKDEHVGADQMDMIKAVADRVALSAENARLFDETTRRAERERIISDIASKIGTSVRTESILRTTASELSHLLEDADIFIDLNIKNTNKKELE